MAARPFLHGGLRRYGMLVTVVPHDEAWQELYETEAARIHRGLL